jgi:exodeoxyribonuclease X
MRLRVIDLESTGEPPERRVVEMGWCDLHSSVNDLGGQPYGWRIDLAPKAQLIDPRRPITPATAAVHHLLDEDVQGQPRFEDYVRRVVGPDSFMPSEEPIYAMVAHSAKFEREFLTDELCGSVPWIDTYKCALHLWPDAPSHSNFGLAYWRRPVGFDRNIARPAHRAGPDAYVTAHHVRDMLDAAPLADLIKWSSQPALLVTCRINPYRDVKWSEVPESMLRWVSDRDFDEDTLYTARYWIEQCEIRRQQDQLAYEAEQRAAREPASI